MGSICGFVGKSDKHLLESMDSLLQHRGSKTANYIDDEVSFSIRFHDNEAAIVENGNIIMAFQGNVYNFDTLANQLNLDEPSDRLSKASLALQLFLKNRDNPFTDLRGSFSCSIYDSSKHELLLFRDHFGQSTLYYCFVNKEIFFASEIKPLLQAQKAVLSVKPHTNRTAIAEYLLYGYVPSPNTLFSKILRLPASSYGRYKRQNPDYLHYYWAPKLVPEISEEKEAIQKTYNTLLETIALNMKKHERHAILLSGGLDSSLLASFVRKCAQREVNSYTFVPPGQTNLSAKSVASFLEFNHNEVTLEAKETLGVLASLVKIYDDLIADPFISLPTYVLIKAIQEEGNVMAADGADNIFWGLQSLYNHFTYVSKILKIPSALRSLTLSLINRFNTAYPYQRSFENLLTASLSKDPYRYMISVFSLRELQKMLENVPTSKDLKGTTSRTFNLAYFYQRQQETAPDRPQLIARIGPLCSNFGIDLIEPFLDVKLVELANSISPSLKQPSMNSGKIVLRKMAHEYKLLPEDFNQKKQGLGCPLDYWLEGELKESVAQLLQDDLPTFISRGFVSSLLRRNSTIDRIYRGSAGYRTSTRDIFSLLMLTLWFKEYSPEIGF